MRRRLLVAAALAALAPRVAVAAPPHRLGILAVNTHAIEAPVWDSMLRALASLGRRESANLAVEWRFADGAADRLPVLARELVQARPDALAAMGSPSTRALQRATSTLPIITGAVADPVLGGFAKSLARPGGNVTGLSTGGSEIAQLQVSLLRAAMPRLAHLTIVIASRDAFSAETAGPLERAARGFGFTHSTEVVANAADMERAIRSVRPGTGALFVYDAEGVEEATFVALAMRQKAPTMFSERRWVRAGGLMSYTLYHEDRMRRVAALLDGALKGIRPADTPFELPANSQFILNLRTAAALGLAIPPDFLTRADEVIE